jgi:predicted PurR-regulated permease PerM
MNLTPAQRQTLLWATVAALLVWALAALGPVLAPFVAAGVLAYALEPGVRWLAAHRTPRVLAVLAVMLVALVAIVAVLLILLPIVQNEIAQVRMRFPVLVDVVTQQLLPWLNRTFRLELRLDGTAIRQWIAQHLADSGQDVAAMVFEYVRSGWTAAMQVLGLVVLVPVVAFFLLLDWPTFTRRAAELVPPRWRANAFDLLGEIDALLGQYLRGQLLVMIALAAYYSIGLLLAGYDLWLPIGVLTGLLVVVPYLGFALGSLFALVSGMLQLGPLPGLVATVVVYGIGQWLESFVLTPRLVGERIGLHPVAVILALLAFGALFGFVGVLVALPMSAVVAVGLRRLRRAWMASDFYRNG